MTAFGLFPSSSARALRRAGCTAVLAAVALLSGCAATTDKEALLNSPTPSPEPVPGQVYRESGVASWYGKDFHGRKTANGETYDMYGLSAAHRTLPLGTHIRVTNLDNYKSITVKVNDRGPYAKMRVLDLSYGAAKQLGFVAQGTAQVKIESLDPIQNAALYTVQVGSFTEPENAKLLKERLSRRYGNITIIPFESNIGTFYRVRIGAYPSEQKAEAVASRLTLEGVEPIVVRKD